VPKLKFALAKQAKWALKLPPKAAIHLFHSWRSVAFALLPLIHLAAICWAKRRPPNKVTVYANFRKVGVRHVAIMIDC
jgi:hypothetical protein